MDFDKLKPRRGVSNGLQPRVLALHSTSRPNHPLYNRRVVSRRGRITPQSQFVVYNTNLSTSKRQPARSGNRRRVPQTNALRTIQASLGQQLKANAPKRSSRRRGNRRRNNQQKKNVNPDTLNKDLDRYFQSDPEVAVQKLNDQLKEYYKDHSVENPAGVSTVEPTASVAPVAPVDAVASSAPPAMTYQASVNQMDVVA